MSRNSTVASIVVLSAMCLSVLTPASADERGVTVKNCIGGYYRGFTCVTTARRGDLNPYIMNVPQPLSEQERAEMQQRDRQWQARCRPVVRQDDYGVLRYSYAARGCEFGKLD